MHATEITAGYKLNTLLQYNSIMNVIDLIYVTEQSDFNVRMYV